MLDAPYAALGLPGAFGIPLLNSSGPPALAALTNKGQMSFMVFEGRFQAEQFIAFCERLFAEQLGGHRLLANRSIWRRFPTVTCERWSHGNLVLLGDAAHKVVNPYLFHVEEALAMYSRIIAASSTIITL